MRARSHKNRSKEWTVCLMDTPIGEIILTFTLKGLAALDFGEEDCEVSLAPEAPESLDPMIDAVFKELYAFFDGRPANFADLPLDLEGTPFQKRVWQELQRIPRGRTISYKELARRAGSPKACRAVGQANGRNPIPIIIPCHRVIAADGTLGGYSSSLDKKRWLLKHEGAM